MDLEGSLVVVSALVLFFGSVWMLLSAVFGVRMGYLVAATGFFSFFLLLSVLWTLGAPGTPRFLGPKGDLPAWQGVAAGDDLVSPTYPVVERYPSAPWKPADSAASTEIEGAFQEFLAEEAAAELKEARVEGEVTPQQFEVTDIRVTKVGERRLAAATAFSTTGGRQIEVAGYHDPGSEGLPSYVALAVAVVGLVVHLPFLDRAERRRKDVLTGGEQAPWRGPA
jgi:hypothetical protein